MKGVDSPVLLAWKIKAGHYIDEKTGKLRIEENFDNYVKAQKVIADANN
jgi:hypothetical protein